MSASGFAYHDYTQPDPPHQPLYLAAMLQFLKGGHNIRRVLDAGCGDGNFTESIAEAGDFEIYGMDLSEGGIARAKERGTDICFAVGSLDRDLREPFSGITSFDAIISVEVIEHLYAPRVFIENAYAALRPGGLLILTTPYWGYWKNILLSVTGRIDRALTPLWEGGHIKHWSVNTLRTLCQDRGFEFVTFKGAGRRIPYLWMGMMVVFRKPGDE